jgi:hypothetical protein
VTVYQTRRGRTGRRVRVGIGVGVGGQCYEAGRLSRQVVVGGETFGIRSSAKGPEILQKLLADQVSRAGLDGEVL